MLGNHVVASASPVATTGATNVVTINVQAASAQASSSATNMGLASFSSADFSVDANGFVTFSGSGSLQTLTGNSGGAVSPTAGNINTTGTGSITVAGNPGSSTLVTQLTGLTSHNVLVGAGTATITNVAPSATSGIPLISQGASADPTFGTAVVAGGGTGATSFNTKGVVVSGSTSTTALSALSLTDGQIVIGSTAGSPAASTLTAGSGISITNASNSITITNTGSIGSLVFAGDSGTASPSGGTITFNANSNSGSSVLFSAASSTVDLKVTDSSRNTIIGALGGNGSLSGSDNTAVGNDVLHSLTSGIFNTGIGSFALNAVTTGGSNVGVGNSALNSINTGSGNIALGSGAGSGYVTGSESNNIVIGNAGTNGESNVLRIGSQGSGGNQQNKCFIAGIVGVTASSSEAVFINSSTGQLGIIPQSSDGQLIIGSSAGSPTAATLTAGTGITITNGHNSITIASSGSEVTWTDEGTNFNAIAGNGYFITGAATATMPASPSQGNVISFAVDAAVTLTITANTGQVIRIGSAVSASGGTAANNARGDSVTLVYRSSDSAWIATSVIGTWTVT